MTQQHRSPATPAPDQALREYPATRGAAATAALR